MQLSFTTPQSRRREASRAQQRFSPLLPASPRFALERSETFRDDGLLLQKIGA